MNTPRLGDGHNTRSSFGSLRLMTAFFLLGFRAEMALFVATLLRSVFLLLILYVFYRMWTVASLGSYQPHQLVWYLALTELVTLSAPIVRDDIEREIGDGSYAVMLQKPVNYGAIKIAEGSGRACGKLPILLAVGGGAAMIFTGKIPVVLQTPLGIVTVASLTLAATIVSTIYLCAIGLSAGFIRDTAPISWVWQKLGFVFGGLMVPLVLYPEWMQQLAKLTPFYYLLFGVGRIVLDENLELAVATAAGIAVWGSLGAALVMLLQRKIENDTIGEGG